MASVEFTLNLEYMARLTMLLMPREANAMGIVGVGGWSELEVP